MSSLKLSPCTLVPWTVCLLFGISAAWADLPSGYFKGSFSGRKNRTGNNAHVFIQTVNWNGYPVSYGMVIDGDEPLSDSALYRIEEVDANTQSWVRLGQSESGILAANPSQEADYSVTLKPTQGSAYRLTMIPTQSGRAVGCAFEITADTADGSSWLPLPQSGTVTVSGPQGSHVTWTPTSFEGKFAFLGTSFQGSFSQSPALPGVNSVRAQTLNPEVADGRSLDRKIVALLTWIKRSGSGLFSRSKDELRLIALPNKSSRSCMDTSIGLSK